MQSCSSWFPGCGKMILSCLFQYNLTLTSSHETTDGLIGILHGRMVVFENGTLKDSVPLPAITEFKCVAGIGCVFMEYVREGKSTLLCRADMSYSRLYATLSKRINRYMQTHAFDYGYEEELELYCPKCGRPYHTGSRVCDHCVDKKTLSAAHLGYCQTLRRLYLFFGLYVFYHCRSQPYHPLFQPHPGRRLYSGRNGAAVAEFSADYSVHIYFKCDPAPAVGPAQAWR